jgi:hypothetical protein
MQVGKDGHASLKRDALASAGVHLDHIVQSCVGHATTRSQKLNYPCARSNCLLATLS